MTALNAHGIHDVQVLTNRGVAAVGSPIHSVRIAQFDHDNKAPFLSEVITERGRVPLAPFLAESDIVVNCTLQDPNAPLTYLRTEDLDAFRPGSLIVDVSCDEGMGFSWAKTTTFAEPMFTVGRPHRLLRGGPQPVLPVELLQLGNQRGAAAVPGNRDHRPRRPGPRTRPSAARSKSATAWSSTRTCCSSSSAEPEYPHPPLAD